MRVCVCVCVCVCVYMSCQAQENGEALALQDEASYALEGLRPQCALSVQQESLVRLAELLATRRGRDALR